MLYLTVYVFHIFTFIVNFKYWFENANQEQIRNYEIHIRHHIVHVRESVFICTVDRVA